MKITNISSEEIKEQISQSNKLILMGLLLVALGVGFVVLDFFIALEHKDNNDAKVQFYTFFILTVAAAGMTIKTFIGVASLWISVLWMKLELASREKP